MQLMHPYSKTAANRPYGRSTAPTGEDKGREGRLFSQLHHYLPYVRGAFLCTWGFPQTALAIPHHSLFVCHRRRHVASLSFWAFQTKELRCCPSFPAE